MTRNSYCDTQHHGMLTHHQSEVMGSNLRCTWTVPSSEHLCVNLDLNLKPAGPKSTSLTTKSPLALKLGSSGI